ncbi:MAG TPA: DUF1592 domain-containing protein [Lunatimonas sp.]|nr:DUF1592 domain-containing protein [Lunatimonas sp.]
MKPIITFYLLILLFSFTPLFGADKEEDAEVDHVKVIQPIVEKHCFSCHHDTKRSGGISIKAFFMGLEDQFEGRIVRGGKLWMHIMETVKTGEMPPAGEPNMTVEERETLLNSVNTILIRSLNANNPGRVVIRRLSHNEYQYSILNLVGVDYDAKSLFPADGSGGAGFDNFPNTLFLTPLKMERYYDAAEEILEEAYADPQKWRNMVPKSYKPNLFTRIYTWFLSLFTGKSYADAPVKAAEEVIIPFASKAFRRFLENKEKEAYLSLFQKVYEGTDGKNRFDIAVMETFKAVLISPNFLYRFEEEQPVNQPYALSNFELASRLSFFLWSTLPDSELFEVAYREDLQDPEILTKQVRRLLNDPKSKRFSESFASQWFGITKLKESSPVDPERFPEFTPSLRETMYQELVEYFHHVLTDSKNLLDLLDSDYTFLNEELAQHYGIQGVKGDELRKVTLTNRNRGGILGMGSVLTATSLPIRTSPVLRGQWVLEQILGTPAPPPPPDAGELSEEESGAENASIKDLLVLHRSKAECMSCHQKMDPIGFGLENFDPIGRWRDGYGDQPIIAWDTLSTGEIFKGPAELKQILISKNELFARNFSEKIFTYAIGRNVEFKDELYIKELVENLLENDFNTEKFIIALVNSYPFRYKVNDESAKFRILASN